MIKWLKNHWLLEDGAVFRYWQLVPESVVMTGHGRIWLHNWKGLVQMWVRYKRVQLRSDKVYVSVHNSYSGYYHWLLESVPKLLEAQRTIPEFTLLLPAGYTATFYEATLRLLKITQLERLQPATIHRVPKLALPYVAETMGDYAKPTLHEIKRVLLEAVGEGAPVAAPVAKRLYISRRKATRRKVLNELEVEALLTKHGFESVCFEDYTFDEQLRLCATTEVLIGIHGAGLANMVFMPEKATVVEFRKFDDGHNYFFTRLATTLQHQYHLLYCAAADERQSVQEADLRVDIAALEAILTQLPA